MFFFKKRLYCIVLYSKKNKKLRSTIQKKLYCIKKDKKLKNNVLKKNCIALYCIVFKKNQISRFPHYRVKAKRLYCIVLHSKK